MRARDLWNPRLIASTGEPDEAFDALIRRLEIGDVERRSHLQLELGGRHVHLSVFRESVTGDDGVVRPGAFRGVRVMAVFEGVSAPQRHRYVSHAERPRVEFSREDAADRDDKKRELVTEVQTGFPDFDEAVFIKNAASKEDVLEVLASPATREAVRRLLALPQSFRIDVSRFGVELSLSERGATRPDVDVIFSALEWLLLIDRGPIDEAPKRRGALLSSLSGVLAALSPSYPITAWLLWPTSWVPAAWGLLAGALTFRLARRLAHRLTIGDFAAGRRVRALRWAWAICIGCAFTGAIIHLNATLDHGPVSVRHGQVTGIRYERKARSTTTWTRVEVRWSDGEEEIFFDDRSITDEWQVTQRRHPGALGIGWREAAVFSR